jgi:hypothetical protein
MRTRTVPLFVASPVKRIDPADAERIAAEGYGATDFGWSCLSLDLIAAENVG